jgi:hypothetical protein
MTVRMALTDILVCPMKLVSFSIPGYSASFRTTEVGEIHADMAVIELSLSAKVFYLRWY